VLGQCECTVYPPRGTVCHVVRGEIRIRRRGRASPWPPGRPVVIVWGGSGAASPPSRPGRAARAPPLPVFLFCLPYVVFSLRPSVGRHAGRLGDRRILYFDVDGDVLVQMRRHLISIESTISIEVGPTDQPLLLVGQTDRPTPTLRLSGLPILFDDLKGGKEATARMPGGLPLSPLTLTLPSTYPHGRWQVPL